MARPSRFSPEVRERAVRMVLDHQNEYDAQWAAIVAISEVFGCSTETLRKWVRQAETDVGDRGGLTSAERERLKRLEREKAEGKRLPSPRCARSVGAIVTPMPGSESSRSSSPHSASQQDTARACAVST